MNIEEKRNAIKEYCNNKGCCNDEPICPLWSGIPDADCYGELKEEHVERNYEILLKAGVFPTQLNETDTEDIINHPNHYTNGGMECIDEMKLVFGKEFTANFCLGNVWKYRYRALTKNGQEDLDKANRYMAMYKEIVDSCRGECDDE